LSFKRGQSGLDSLFKEKVQQRLLNKMYNWRGKDQAKWAIGALAPGWPSNASWLSKEVSRTGPAQHIQDLLLGGIQFGKKIRLAIRREIFKKRGPTRKCSPLPTATKMRIAASSPKILFPINFI